MSQLFIEGEKLRTMIPDDLPKSDSVITYVEREFAEKYGGFTSYKLNEGGWYDKDGKRHDDSITIVETVNDEGDIDEAHAKHISMQVKQRLNEKEIMMDISDTEVAFVEDNKLRSRELSKKDFVSKMINDLQ